MWKKAEAFKAAQLFANEVAAMFGAPVPEVTPGIMPSENPREWEWRVKFGPVWSTAGALYYINLDLGARGGHQACKFDDVARAKDDRGTYARRLNPFSGKWNDCVGAGDYQTAAAWIAYVLQDLRRIAAIDPTALDAWNQQQAIELAAWRLAMAGAA